MSYKCKDKHAIPDEIHQYTAAIRDANVPLVIDNGSYHCRVGWATSSEPELNFKNVIAKNRGNRKERDWDVQVANDIADLETVRWLLRTPYDFNVVINYSVQETLFDYALKHLNVNGDGSVDHPVVMTEAIANPTHCRKNMSELMFEAYSIPSIAYGVDCLFSHYFNKLDDFPETALIITAGFQSTHVLPIVNGDPDIKNSFRINLGGYNCSAYLQRLLQFKHPQYLSELTLTRMDEVIQKVCHVATNYGEEVERWSDVNYENKNTSLIHFTPRGGSGSNVKSTSLRGGPLQLEKKLKQTEYKLYEVECVIELEHENPEAATKVARDAGCSGLEQLKELAEKIRENIKMIRTELDEQYHVDNTNNTDTNFVQFGIEKTQAPEIVFQPSLVGYDQCGISDCIELLMQKYPKSAQELMAQNVFITGGSTKVNGFMDRIVTDMRQMRPYQSEITVTQAKDPSLDAWKGAAKWATSDHNCWITKADFEECGWDYLKVHRFSNRWVQAKST